MPKKKQPIRDHGARLDAVRSFLAGVHASLLRFPQDDNIEVLASFVRGLARGTDDNVTATIEVGEAVRIQNVLQSLPSGGAN